MHETVLHRSDDTMSLFKISFNNPVYVAEAVPVAGDGLYANVFKNVFKKGVWVLKGRFH